LAKKEIILTRDGYRKLNDELNFLITKRRKEIAERIKDSREFGELLENPEYNDAKDEQAFIENRIRQLNELLSLATVIESKKVKTDRVELGSTVTLKDLETDEEVDYLLVGSVEADPTNHRISNESPVGQAIIGKKKGEVVKVEAPHGCIEYKIVGIHK
jgi:transcription elongation factor GreA